MAPGGLRQPVLNLGGCQQLKRKPRHPQQVRNKPLSGNREIKDNLTSRNGNDSGGLKYTEEEEDKKGPGPFQMATRLCYKYAHCPSHFLPSPYNRVCPCCLFSRAGAHRGIQSHCHHAQLHGYSFPKVERVSGLSLPPGIGFGAAEWLPEPEPAVRTARRVKLRHCRRYQCTH